MLAPSTVTAQFSYIHESIGQGDVSGISANKNNKLNQLRIKATYSYQAKYGTSSSYFGTTGSADTVLYPDAASNPDTRGWIPELFWEIDRPGCDRLRNTFDAANESNMRSRPFGGRPQPSPFGECGSNAATNAFHGVAASISARKRSRRVSLYMQANSMSEKLVCVILSAEKSMRYCASTAGATVRTQQ